MSGFLAVFVAVVASVASGGDGAARNASAELGESFQLRAGECMAIAGEGLSVGFESVAADSRCPKDVTCIWEGDATVRIWLRRPPEEKVTRELHTAARGPRPESYLGFEVRLLRLDPHPVSGRPIAPADYRATLEVVRASPTATTTSED